MDAFEEAIALARAVSLTDGELEAAYSVSLVCSGRNQDALVTAASLGTDASHSHSHLAELFYVLDDRVKAQDHALAGYRIAWADGPPFAFHWNLEKCRKVLRALGSSEPELPTFHPKKVKPFSFERDLTEMVRAMGLHFRLIDPFEHMLM